MNPRENRLWVKRAWNNEKIRSSIHSATSRTKTFLTARNFLIYFYKKEEAFRIRTRLPTLAVEPLTTGPNICSDKNENFGNMKADLKHYLFLAVFLWQVVVWHKNLRKKNDELDTEIQSKIKSCILHILHTHTKSINTKPIYLCFWTKVQKYVIWTCDWPRNVFIIYKMLFSGVMQWDETPLTISENLVTILLLSSHLLEVLWYDKDMGPMHWHLFLWLWRICHWQ